MRTKTIVQLGALVLLGAAIMDIPMQAQAAAPPAVGQYVIPSFDHIDDVEALQAATSEAQRAIQDIVRARSQAAKTPAELSAVYDGYTQKMRELAQASGQRYEQLLVRENERRAAAAATPAAPAAGAPAATASAGPGSVIASRVLQPAASPAPAQREPVRFQQIDGYPADLSAMGFGPGRKLVDTPALTLYLLDEPEPGPRATHLNIFIAVRDFLPDEPIITDNNYNAPVSEQTRQWLERNIAPHVKLRQITADPAGPAGGGAQVWFYQRGLRLPLIDASVPSRDNTVPGKVSLDFFPQAQRDPTRRLQPVDRPVGILEVGVLRATPAAASEWTKRSGRWHFNTVAELVAEDRRYDEIAAGVPEHQARQQAGQSSPEMAAIEALPPSDRLRAFKYEDYRYLGSVAGRDYFMLPALFDNRVKAEGHDPFAPPASFDGSLRIAIVHDVGESEHILDFDFFPVQNKRNERALGYRLADAEAARFNRELRPTLDPILERSPALREVSVYHYVRSRPLPLLRGSAQLLPAGQNPVLSARWKPGVNGAWEPAYRYVDNEAGHFAISEGYSYASALRSIQRYEESVMTGRAGINVMFWDGAVEEAYQHASAAAKTRRPQIAHWTMGYWGLAHDKLGRDLLEGRFDQVPHDGNFDDFFMAWVSLYEWHCAEFISPAAHFKHTRTWREMRQYLYIEEWVDKEETFEAIMEPRFLETFQRNFERGPLNGRPGGPQTSTDGSAFAISESAVRRNAIRGLLRGDGCQSPHVRRLADNLYRHSQTDDGS